jgi:dTDP-glucose pyrophosphorylase
VINIVIPMAGEGSRFKEAGYTIPKPFLPVFGQPMIQSVIENVRPLEESNVYLIARRDHASLLEPLVEKLNGVYIIYIDEVTQGAACTVLKAERYINNNNPLIIANSDQLVKWNNASREVKIHYGYTSNLVFKEQNSSQDLINLTRVNLTIGSIATFKADHPKWSYVRSEMDCFGVPIVKEVAEKKVISNDATCGIYYYAAGRLFCEAAHKMIVDDERVNGEFYVCPVYNKMIKLNPTGRISHYPVERMIGLGTPSDYEFFLVERSLI